MVARKVSLANTKHQYHASQCGDYDCGAQSQKEWRLLWESKFDSFHEWTLVTRKMVERKAFLANSKDQYLVSLCGEHVCSLHNKKNGDYNEYQSLSHFTIEL